MLPDSTSLLLAGMSLGDFSPWIALALALLLGILLGAVPTGAAEPVALAAGTVEPRSLVVPILLALSVGHVLGKGLWYWLGTLGDRVTHPKVRSWIDRARQLAALHPRLGIGMVVSSALASVPPFHLMAVAAGVVRTPIVPFFVLACVGRMLRFGAIASIPWVLSLLQRG